MMRTSPREERRGMKEIDKQQRFAWKAKPESDDGLLDPWFYTSPEETETAHAETVCDSRPVVRGGVS